MEPPFGTSRKTPLSCLPSNKSFLKLFLILCGIILVICVFYQRIGIDNRKIHTYDSRDRATNQSSSSIPKKKEEKIVRRPGNKIFIALSYYEQLTMGTNNFLELTALAAYGGRQVVLPFVKNSFYHGVQREEVETLSLYYSVSALNRTLCSRGHGTLISWKEFEGVCQGKLDVLVHFDYTKVPKYKTYNGTTTGFPCNAPHTNTSRGFKVERTICMNVFAVDSVAKFENDVIERLPCVGFAKWQGSRREHRNRARFDLREAVPDPMQFSDAANFFSSRLLHIARDFIEKRLGSFFVSVHIRAEKIYIATLKENINGSAAVKKCISDLATLVQGYKNASRVPIPLFLATDFADMGSWSGGVKDARENAKSLMKILAPLKPIIFQPSTYNLTDRGAVAIVEMNIIVSGKRLFVAGGGSFQEWQVNAFLDKTNIDQKAKGKCKNNLCQRLCCL